MKYSILTLLILSIFIANPILATDFFSFQKKNCKYETAWGMLHGDFSQEYPNGKKMVVGKFNHNQRVGTWNFYNINGRLLEKRLYFNNYEYAVMDKEGKTWKQFDANGEWSPIDERNIKFKQRIWKQIDNESNGYLNIDELVKAVNTNKTGDFFADDRFTTEMEKPVLKNITSIKIKEDYIYDNEQEAMFVRPIGIGFENEQGKTLAWIYFPDWKETLRKVKTTWHNDHLNLRNLYDVFAQRAYNAVPYKLGREKITDKSMAELELEMIHMENMFIIAKA